MVDILPIKPKVNWGYTVSTNTKYVGDRFTTTDYNRLKQNIEYLSRKANTVFKRRVSTYNSTLTELNLPYIYAKNINEIVRSTKELVVNLRLEYLNDYVKRIINNSSLVPYFHYQDNGRTMLADELNFIERIMELLEVEITEHTEYRKLSFNLGNTGGI